MSGMTLKLVFTTEGGILTVNEVDQVLPSSISYQDKENSLEQSTNQCWRFFETPLQVVGQILRNAFYLPLYNQRIDRHYLLDQEEAKRIADALKNAQVFCYKESDTILSCFTVRDIPVRLEGPISREFIVRVFESKTSIQDKKLRLILFSFNGNRETREGTGSQRWNPLTIRALSESSLSVLRALKASDIRVDSLAATSLGNVALDGLKHLSSEEYEIIPPILIINRGLTSIQKVANKLYSFPLNYILHGAAKLFGWNADPEQELLNFLENNRQKPGQPKRKVILIEALMDFYFSEQGKFQSDIHDKIVALGASVFRAKFYPVPFHVRSHHALSLDHLVNNSVTEILADTIPLELDPNEKISSAIARSVFFSGEDTFHTCFYICGNDATLDTGTVREAMPLLSAFIEEGQKIAQANADHPKDEIAS